MLLIPFLGTILGASCVYFMKGKMNKTVHKTLLGFAAGVMVAASIWSLIIPAMDLSKDMGKLSFIPAAVGFLLGILFLLLLDVTIPHLHTGEDEPEGIKAHLGKSTMLILAVTLHNIPEGMAVGILYAGYVSGNAAISFSAALSLAIGIAIQNFPEGAIISMPLRSEGLSKNKSFVYGALSGIVEPIGAALTIVAASLIEPVLPYLLSFAAGAMMYVVVEELIPESAEGGHSNIAVIGFAVGFTLMMVLDVALG
ncbi:ZIP family metal transporter [Peptostreptococcaceae bacterium OttesenSCG-928-C18]|nr:ZIP family metal transporter [Peptostreptococcaceae bacterium OttesenSCG-928-C18]